MELGRVGSSLARNAADLAGEQPDAIVPLMERMDGTFAHDGPLRPTKFWGWPRDEADSSEESRQ